MCLWFLTLAVLGVMQIARDPTVLLALSPTYAVGFLAGNPLAAFLSLGAVVLAVTGTEALYADMGHFGARPIRRAWLWFVLPALVDQLLRSGRLADSRLECGQAARFSCLRRRGRSCRWSFWRRARP